MNTSTTRSQQRKGLLMLLAAAAFMIMFQAYMVAPLIPRLAVVFGVSVEKIALIVPAYLLPYGLITLVNGPLSDRLGRAPLVFGPLTLFVTLTALTALAHSWTALLAARLLTGLGASGLIPAALVLVGDIFPYQERGQAIGLLFGAMAAGMALGSTAGAVLEPIITWRGLFLGVAALAFVLLLLLLRYRPVLRQEAHGGAPVSVRDVLAGNWSLLRSRRGVRTYAYSFINGIFHSGTYTWLGLYFAQRYGLSGAGIGLALLGYGVPGALFGPAIGRLADRRGRSRLIPAGVVVGGLAACALAFHVPVIAAALLVTVLSLGYDMTQPLLAAIVTDLGPNRGMAMGLNAFVLFVGYGLGSLVFSGALRLGLDGAFGAFGVGALITAALAVPLFRSEAAPRQRDQLPASAVKQAGREAAD